MSNALRDEIARAIHEADVAIASGVKRTDRLPVMSYRYEKRAEAVLAVLKGRVRAARARRE